MRQLGLPGVVLDVGRRRCRSREDTRATRPHLQWSSRCDADVATPIDPAHRCDARDPAPRLAIGRRRPTRPPVVAVLGGGQLGRMLGLAGIPLGVRFRFLDPSPEAPARRGRRRSSSARSTTSAALARGRRRRATSSPTSGKACPPAPRATLAATRAGPTRPARARGRPGPARREGRRSARLGIAVAPFAAVDDRDDLAAAVDDDRAARGAEDAARRLRRQGPGRAPRRRPTLDAAWDALGGGRR